MQENAHNVNEFSRAFGWTMDAYAAALVFLWCVDLAIQPPRVSGSAQTLGPFVHVPTLRKDDADQRPGERATRSEVPTHFGMSGL